MAQSLLNMVITGPRKLAGRFPILIPIVVVVVLLAPFLRRAFGMDDPLFIWPALQILKHPLDPYGFTANWEFLSACPFYAQTQSPPLNSYFIAGVIRLIGLSELRLHLAFLLPAIGVASGTFLLARRFCARPVGAALAGILTPAFLVSGSTVMCDMLMLAFWVWAVVFWLKGMDEKRPWMLVLSGVLITLSALTKFYGIVLIPLMIAHFLLSKRKPGWGILYFLIPVLALVAYQYWTKSLYGKGLLMGTIGFAGKFQSVPAVVIIPKMVVGLSFTGGCIASMIFLGPLLWTRKQLAGWLGLGAIVALLFAIPGIPGSGMGCRIILTGHDRWILALHMGAFVAAGASLLTLAAKDLAATRDADSALLFLWTAGAFVFATVFNWTVNGRAILAMAPVAGILMMRQIERRGSEKPSASPSFALPWVLSALLALTVARADYQFVNSERDVAFAIHQLPTEGTTWFAGHWGFQYYMERLGAKPYDENSTIYRLGDLLVIPANNACWGEPPAGTSGTTGEFPGPRWLSTMNRSRQTAFHASMWGPIPYGFGLTAPEIYYLVPVDEMNIDLLTNR